MGGLDQEEDLGWVYCSVGGKVAEMIVTSYLRVLEDLLIVISFPIFPVSKRNSAQKAMITLLSVTLLCLWEPDKGKNRIMGS